MRDVRELCRRLKPILGGRADLYWLTYLAEDAAGKAELETILQLMAAKHLGTQVEHPDTFLSAPDSKAATGSYPLGTVSYGGKALHPFGLREEELIQHVAVFGRSGAGKTNTVIHFIENLLGHEKSFLIFDWKRNYRDLLAAHDGKILVYTVGRDVAPFAFNPLIPPAGTDASTWLKKLIEIIAHAYYLGEGVMYLFQEAIHAVFQDSGVYEGDPDRYPTFRDVEQWLKRHPAKGRKALWMDSAIRGMGSLCFGHMGNVVNTAVQPNIADLLDGNVILELDGLTNNDKTFLTEALLLWIHHYRLSQPERETFKHALLIEEAHHILRKQAAGGSESITETILREIRELGEAIILVDQHPSMISIPALGNTYATIAMNLKHRSDVSAMAAAMLLDEDERELLGRLEVGAAIVKLQGRWTSLFRIQISHRAIPKGAVNDDAIAVYMAQHDPLRTALTHDQQMEAATVAPAGPDSIPEGERSLLVDVAEHPYSGVVERYKRLQVSRRKGNTWKEGAIAQGLLETVDIPTPSGRIVLLQLTHNGRKFLVERGHAVHERQGWGGLEHEYWKHKVFSHPDQLGLEPKMEVPVNGFTDIIATTAGQEMAIEVETGKSDWKRNIEKNLKRGFARILLLSTNEDAERQLLKGLALYGEVECEIRLIPAHRVLTWRNESMLDALFTNEDLSGAIPAIPVQTSALSLDEPD